MNEELIEKEFWATRTAYHKAVCAYDRAVSIVTYLEQLKNETKLIARKASDTFYALGPDTIKPNPLD